ncbi:MAG: ferrochelatase [Deltaproteobacteria bacterium CG2_30_63_29]|nr:MAG: ferrochelatase [Deltaproteobacteria bacterium CG2_30_63_29]
MARAAVGEKSSKEPATPLRFADRGVMKFGAKRPQENFMSDRAPTGIVMLNMGGPDSLDGVGPFLEKLFRDRELIELPMQSVLGPFIVSRRTPKVVEVYRSIGGGSPITRGTREQGDLLAVALDRISPSTAPHKSYIAFRYTPPYAHEALEQMLRDKVHRAVAFSQYPQYACPTSGSSLNDLWRAVDEMKLGNHFDWSVIDRWPTHPALIDTLCEGIREALGRFPPEHRDEVVLVFSAHSLPLKVIYRGDSYPQEVGATVQAIVDTLGLSQRYMLAYQSAVGPVKWLGPSTVSVIEQLSKQGATRVLVVPVAFTSDHVETLEEIDIQLRATAARCGIEQFERAPVPNARPTFINGLAYLVAEHLASGQKHSTQYQLKCPGCPREGCRELR